MRALLTAARVCAEVPVRTASTFPVSAFNSMGLHIFSDDGVARLTSL